MRVLGIPLAIYKVSLRKKTRQKTGLLIDANRDGLRGRLKTQWQTRPGEIFDKLKDLPLFMISLRKSISYIGCAFAAIGILFTFSIGFRMYKFLSKKNIFYETKFDDFNIRHSNLADNLNYNDLLSKLENDFVQKYFDTVRTLIGNSTLPLPAIRITLQFRFDNNLVAIFYDYAFPCGTCPTFPLWRANVFYDENIADLMFIDIVYREVSPMEYLTFKSDEGGEKK